jgi:hypothetical protein
MIHEIDGQFYQIVRERPSGINTGIICNQDGIVRPVATKNSKGHVIEWNIRLLNMKKKSLL